MKIDEILHHTFQDIYHNSGMKVEINNNKISSMYMTMWGHYLSTDSSLCRNIVSHGHLTLEQMQHAALRYRLGKTLDEGVIFWSIDADDHVIDGHIIWYDDTCHPAASRPPTWMSLILCQKFDIPTSLLGDGRCLFGLHLLQRHYPPLPRSQRAARTVMIVENEVRALVLSELKPHYTWLSIPSGHSLTAEHLRPLRQGTSVVLYVDPGADEAALKEWQHTVGTLMTQMQWDPGRRIQVRALPEEYRL